MLFSKAEGSYRLRTRHCKLSDGQHVKLTIEDDASLIELAARVYEGLSDKEISCIEEIASNRGDFFSGEGRP
jgi:hypothetical protein